MSTTGTVLADDLGADALFEGAGASNGTLIPGTDFGIGVAPRLLAATATGQLAGTFEDARWIPIVVTIFVPLGFQGIAMVTAELGDSAHWHTAYRGDLGFSPLFEDLSTVTAPLSTGGGYNITLSLLPLGGWVSSPAVTPGAFLEAV